MASSIPGDNCRFRKKLSTALFGRYPSKQPAQARLCVAWHNTESTAMLDIVIPGGRKQAVALAHDLDKLMRYKPGSDNVVSPELVDELYRIGLKWRLQQAGTKYVYSSDGAPFFPLFVTQVRDALSPSMFRDICLLLLTAWLLRMSKEEFREYISRHGVFKAGEIATAFLRSESEESGEPYLAAALAQIERMAATMSRPANNKICIQQALPQSP
jgi:hypothetical protein